MTKSVDTLKKILKDRLSSKAFHSYLGLLNIHVYVILFILSKTFKDIPLSKAFYSLLGFFNI